MRPLDQDIHRRNDLKDARDSVGPTQAHLTVHDTLSLLRFEYDQIEVVAVHAQGREGRHSAFLFLLHHPSQSFNASPHPDGELNVRRLVAAERRFGLHVQGNRAFPDAEHRSLVDGLMVRGQRLKQAVDLVREKVRRFEEDGEIDFLRLYRGARTMLPAQLPRSYPCCFAKQVSNDPAGRTGGRLEVLQISITDTTTILGMRHNELQKWYLHFCIPIVFLPPRFIAKPGSDVDFNRLIAHSLRVFFGGKV